MGRKLEAGAPWINIVGEPIWAGRSDEEITAWTRFESIFNLVFASAPATAICPYDTRSLPEAIVADAHRTHPVVTHGTDAIESSTYSAPEDLILEP